MQQLTKLLGTEPEDGSGVGVLHVLRLSIGWPSGRRIARHYSYRIEMSSASTPSAVTPSAVMSAAVSEFTPSPVAPVSRYAALSEEDTGPAASRRGDAVEAPADRLEK